MDWIATDNECFAFERIESGVIRAPVSFQFSDIRSQISCATTWVVAHVLLSGRSLGLCNTVEVQFDVDNKVQFDVQDGMKYASPLS